MGMQLNIKGGEAYALASGLAALTGESPTSAVTQALRDWREHCRLGPGRHPARLNLADCLARAPAKRAPAKTGRAPLLFKGSDFSHTDIEPALKD
jgi:uncharacterized protein with PIN domain